ncbi:MAG: DNA processing protein [Pseudohongiellaceae bacterium]|jgi:DNA processing protein
MQNVPVFPDGLIALALHQSTLTEKQLRELFLFVDSLNDIFSLSLEQIQQFSLTSTHRLELEKIQLSLQQVFTSKCMLAQQWQYCVDKNIGILSLNQQAYPALLKQIYDPPPIIYYRGDIRLINTPQLAMVGSRRSSQQGNHNALLFAKAFAKAGFTVTSGLALGIDAESHLGALSVEGNTIAVLGTGVDVIYPWRNRDLYQTIVDHGLVISELPLGSEPKKYHFPKRNRIISGLSLGVLVVEATVKSGSLITAKCALDQDREVFAMPGSIHNPSSRGCHALIRQGAKLIETVEHVMEEFSGWLSNNNDENKQPEQVELNLNTIEPQQKKLLEQIGFDPQPVDLIQQRTSLPVTELMAMLVQLELKGVIENIAGNYQRVM